MFREWKRGDYQKKLWNVKKWHLVGFSYPHWTKHVNFIYTNLPLSVAKTSEVSPPHFHTAGTGQNYGNVCLPDRFRRLGGREVGEAARSSVQLYSGNGNSKVVDTLKENVFLPEPSHDGGRTQQTHAFCVQTWEVILFWSEVKWVTVKFLGTKVPCALGWPYTEDTSLYCDYFIWGVSCTVVVCTCFVMCGWVYVWVFW